MAGEHTALRLPPSSNRRNLDMKTSVAAFVALLVPLAALATTDPAEGRRLIETHKCETCHQDRVYGTVGTIYLRKDRKVTSWSKLKAQVAVCNSRFNFGLFPEDEENIAAYLNATYYKLPTK